MRVHTAPHILCGVIWRDYEAHVTSSAKEPGQARQDFELERLTLDFVTEVERRVNAEIEANREVRIRTKVNLLPEKIEVVRVCEIADLET